MKPSKCLQRIHKETCNESENDIIIVEKAGYRTIWSIVSFQMCGKK